MKTNNPEDLWVMYKHPRKRISKVEKCEKSAHCVYSQREEWKVVNQQIAEKRRELKSIVVEEKPTKYYYFNIFLNKYVEVSEWDAKECAAHGMTIYNNI